MFLHSKVRDFRSTRVSQSLPGNDVTPLLGDGGGCPGKRRRWDCVEARACSRNNRRLNLKRRRSEPLRDRERAWRRAAPRRRRSDDVVVAAHAKAPMTMRTLDAADRERRDRGYQDPPAIALVNDRVGKNSRFHSSYAKVERIKLAGEKNDCFYKSRGGDALNLDCTGSL